VVRRRHDVTARPHGGSRVSVRVGVRFAGRRRTTSIRALHVLRVSSYCCVLLLSPDHRLSNSALASFAEARRGRMQSAPPGQSWHRRGARSRSRSGESRALRRARSRRTACAFVVQSIRAVLESAFSADPRDADGRAHARAEPDVAGQRRPLRARMREGGRGAGHGSGVGGSGVGVGAARIAHALPETRKSRLRGSPEATRRSSQGDPRRRRASVGPVWIVNIGTRLPGRPV
jgi:hypothetical protein